MVYRLWPEPFITLSLKFRILVDYSIAYSNDLKLSSSFRLYYQIGERKFVYLFLLRCCK